MSGDPITLGDHLQEVKDTGWSKPTRYLLTVSDYRGEREITVVSTVSLEPGVLIRPYEYEPTVKVEAVLKHPSQKPVIGDGMVNDIERATRPVG
jgi:hypothetical protein